MVGRRRGRTGRGWDAAPPRARSQARESAGGTEPVAGHVDDSDLAGEAAADLANGSAADTARGQAGALEAGWTAREDLELDEDGWPVGSVPASPGRGRGKAGPGRRRRAVDGGDQRASGADRAEGGGPEGSEQDPAERAREICLRLLAVRPRTRAELASALKQRSIPADVAAEVLERYGEVGIIDDRAFAQAWVTSRHHGRGLAKRALANELRHKGVDDEAVGSALAELDADTEAATARALVERKLRSTPGGTPDALLRRLVGMLARKGYSPGLALRVVREALADWGEETDIPGADLDDWATELR